MNKDVIYIDVEDDITAIIGKIKASKEKIVALVPPRHSTVLQSAVNLRLLERMAKGSTKQLVVVTNNQALVALASAAKIPVAKNLQSKPEIAEIPALAVDDDDDIIDGSQLPVGEHAAMAGTREPLIKPKSLVPVVDSNELEDIDIDGEPVAGDAAAVATKAVPASSKKPKSKIPNFSSFRKKLFWGIFGAIVVAGVLIWMYVFAPAATVIVTAKAASTNISGTVTLGDSAATDFTKGIVSSVTQTIKKDEKVDFTATGTKDVGNKASGTVQFYNARVKQSVTIAAGTTITANGNNYITQDAATVPSGDCISIGCDPGSPSNEVNVVAASSGQGYNVDSGTKFSVSGQGPSSGAFSFYAVNPDDIAGGTTKTAVAVSQSDVDQAKAQLQGSSQDASKKSLQAKFTSDQIIIDDSYTVTTGDAVSAPAVGEALPDGTTKATLTVSTTYTMTAVPKSAAQAYIKAALTAQITDKKAQRIYEGNEKIAFSNYGAPSNGVAAAANINAVGYIGPNLQASDLKTQVAGLKTGQVQDTVGAISGVNDVKVKYSYFWVTKVPNDPKKVTIEFKIND